VRYSAKFLSAANGHSVIVENRIEGRFTLPKIDKFVVKHGRLHAGCVPAVIRLVYSGQIGHAPMSSEAQPHLEIRCVREIRPVAAELPL